MTARSRRLAVIGDTYADWVTELAGTVTPDPTYAKVGPSQYPEGLEVLSAPVTEQDDLIRQTNAALGNAGVPINFPPGGLGDTPAEDSGTDVAGS